MKNEALLRELTTILGRRHLLSQNKLVDQYCTGIRFGSGEALAVALPGTLVELWKTVEACVEAGAVIIMQAANTGLTGGSTPYGVYDRPVVIISTTLLKGLHVLNDGREVICMPGATLFELERALQPLNREPHSVIGSSCIGASVMGGIANNSGGALIQRGPAYSEMALFVQIADDGKLRMVNHLGIHLGNDPETMLTRLEAGDFGQGDVEEKGSRHASDDRYVQHVRQIDEETPARFNADTRCLFEASGCAGKLIIFAVRLDTFPKADHSTVFYLGTSDPAEFAELRRDMLTQSMPLPISAEYIHRDAFDIARRYGKDMFLTIRWLGTSRIPQLFRLKDRLDRFGRRFGFRTTLSDRIMHWLGLCFPQHLPRRLLEFRDKYEHHLILHASGDADETRACLTDRFPSETGGFFECTKDEADKAMLHRFVVAGAATRYRAIHQAEIEDIVALDIALPRNTTEWKETLPGELGQAIIHKLYYGHFFCHVFHQDYLIAKGCDPDRIKHWMLAILDERGARYPAEHNVGHLYDAHHSQIEFFQRLDPCNQLNPGIGGTSKRRNWGS